MKTIETISPTGRAVAVPPEIVNPVNVAKDVAMLKGEVAKLKVENQTITDQLTKLAKKLESKTDAELAEVLVGVWHHVVLDSPMRQATVHFRSGTTPTSGRCGWSPSDDSGSWTIKDRVLILDWGKGPQDMLVLAGDGRSYSGRDPSKLVITGYKK
jgi:hypothetical protein